MTAVVGKWQARVTEQGDDKRGLGRWSFLRLSSKKQNLVIITAYRPTPFERTEHKLDATVDLASRTRSA
jgi:hypothetical protein